MPSTGASVTATIPTLPPAPIRHYPKNSRKDNPYLRLSMVAMGVLSLTAIGTIYGASGVDALLWALLIAVIVMPVLLSPSLRLDAFHPYSYFAFNGLVAFGIPALLVLRSHSSNTPLGHYTPTLLLLGAAFFLYWLGYSSPIATQLARMAPTIVFSSRSNETYVIPALALYALGWAGRFLRGGLGVSHLPTNLSATQEQASGILGYLSLLGTLSFITLLAFLFSRRKHSAHFMIIALALILIEVIAGAIDGGRTAILLPIMYGAFVLSWFKRRLPFVSLALIYIVAVVLVGPLLTLYRESYYQLLRGGNRPSLSTVLEAANDARERQGRSAAAIRKEVTRARNVNVESTLRVLDRTPSLYPYAYGSQFLDGAEQLLLPRIVWKDKPTFSPGRVYAAQYWDFSRDDLTSMPIGLPAEAYLNFGYFGLALFPLLGVAFRVVADTARSLTNHNLGSIVITHFVLFVMANMTTTFLGLVVGSLRQAVIYVIFLLLVHRRLPKLIHNRYNKGLAQPVKLIP